MLITEKQQADFRKEFNISEESFRESRLTWEELDQIAEDFDSKRDEHQNTVKRYAEVLQKCDGVHSLSYRVKDTSHLVEKIIRKNPKYIEEGDSLSKDNYESKITDLMGIRILLLFKEDWLSVHDYIMKKYQDALFEPPFVYVRPGDSKLLYEGKLKILEKEYRSVHYVLKTEHGYGVEVQVRTLYEEAWSEIDHKLRYPYDMTNEMLSNYLKIMNNLTGMGDEMGTFLNSYMKAFQENMHSGIVEDNEVYQFILEEIEKFDNLEVKQAIIDKIKQASNYKQMENLSALLREIMSFK